MIPVVIGLAVAIAGGRGAAWLWRRVRPGRDGLVECALGLLGLVCTASVTTLGLYAAWTGRLVPPSGAPSLDDPLFGAALLGTMAGHLALLAWARGLGASLAVVPAGARWWALAVPAGLAGVAGSVAWTWGVRLLGMEMAEQELVGSVLTGPSGVTRALTLGFMVLGAPVLEELVFRGFLQGTLALRVGGPRAAVVSALAFGFFHIADPQVVPVLIGIGALLAWLRMRSGSVLPSMLAHMVNNGVALLLALSFGG